MTDHHSRTASEEEEVSKLDSPLVQLLYPYDHTIRIVAYPYIVALDACLVSNSPGRFPNRER
jgi:hypothetical protein